MVENFLTVKSLAEFPVIVLLVGIITQLLKRPIDWIMLKAFNIINMPTEIISFVISLFLLFSVTYINGSTIGLDGRELFALIFMNIVNALIVSLAANKGYERVTSKETVISRIQRKKY